MSRDAHAFLSPRKKVEGREEDELSTSSYLLRRTKEKHLEEQKEEGREAAFGGRSFFYELAHRERSS